jgi:GT2 family glycosyltransferase
MTGTGAEIRTVSVIIPNLNCPILDQALDALRAQHLEPGVSVEIIVIGRDEPGHLRGYPDVLFIQTEHPVPPGVARNIGIEKAKGELIACLDADCIADPMWLAAMLVAHREHPHQTVIGGSIQIDADNYWALADNLSSFHGYLPSRAPAPYPVLPTCNVSMRKNAFKQVGLFAPEMVFDEDADWMMRAREKGFTLQFYPSARIWHRTQRSSFQATIAHAQIWGDYSIITRHRYRDVQPLPFILSHWWSLLAFSPLIAAAVTARIYARNPRTVHYLYTSPVIFLAKMAWCWGAARRLQKGFDLEGQAKDKDNTTVRNVET